MPKKLRMPTYVIVPKREFEKLFEKIDIEGKTITGLNVKTKKKRKTNPRIRLRTSSEKSPKKSKNSRSEEVSTKSDATSDGKQTGVIGESDSQQSDPHESSDQKSEESESQKSNNEYSSYSECSE